MLKILQQAKKDVDEAEVYWLRDDSMTASLANGRLEYVRQGSSSSAALRVIADGRIGAAFGESPEQGELLGDAHAASAFGSAAGHSFAAEQPNRLDFAFDPRIADLEVGGLADACLGIDERIRRLAPDAEPSILCAAGVRSLRIATSEGVDAEERSTRFVIRVVIPFADRGTDIGAYGLALGRSMSIPTEEWVADLVEQRNLGAQPSQPPAGRLPVLLSPQVSNLLTTPLAAGLDGHAIADKTSPLCGKLDERIFSHLLTIREDPACDELFQPRSFDDEGIACQPRALVDAGALIGYITDLRSAHRLDDRSTGNAVRRTMFSENIDDAPVPSLLGAIIEPGETPFRDLMAGIDNGLLVTYIRGLHSGNIAQGIFSVQVDGFHIVGGRIAGYLSKTMISGNIYEDFQAIRGLSLESEPTAQGSLSVSGMAPYVLLDSVQVTVG